MIFYYYFGLWLHYWDLILFLFLQKRQCLDQQSWSKFVEYDYLQFSLLKVVSQEKKIYEKFKGALAKFSGFFSNLHCSSTFVYKLIQISELIVAQSL